MNTRVSFMPCNCMKTYVNPNILENVLERLELQE
jgi:hypothetical protein